MVSQQNIHGWILDEKVLPDQRLTQGDLIRFPDEKDPLRQAGLVVTADCDLEQRKHGRLVTLVPIITTKTVLEYYLLIEACDRQRQQIFNYARNAYGLKHIADDSLAAEELRAAASEDSNHKLRIARLAVEIYLHQKDTVTASEYLELMRELKIATSNSVGKMANQIKSKGDLVVIPSARQLGVDGDIAWVRHIWQVPLGRVAIRTSELRRDGERVARLDSPYRYRITQVMGQVFADIGLPNVTRRFEDEIEEALK